MKKILMFGSKHWPECSPAKELLLQNNINYLYLDITENMFNLKKFLKFRDNYKVFNEIKINNRVGLPCIIVNNGEEIIFDIEESLDKLKE